MGQLADWVARVRAARRSPRVALLDAALAPPPDPRPLLLQVAAEAVIRQDEAEDLLRGLRARVNLGLLAPWGGPLVRRFFALQDLLPGWCADPVDEMVRSELGMILHHHAMALSVAMDLAACEWRSARLAAQIDALDGLGPPARRLDALYAELARGELLQQPYGYLAIGRRPLGRPARAEDGPAQGRRLGETDRLGDRRLDHGHAVVGPDPLQHRTAVGGAGVLHRRQHRTARGSAPPAPRSGPTWSRCPGSGGSPARSRRTNAAPVSGRPSTAARDRSG